VLKNIIRFVGWREVVATLLAALALAVLGTYETKRDALEKLSSPSPHVIQGEAGLRLAGWDPIETATEFFGLSVLPILGLMIAVRQLVVRQRHAGWRRISIVVLALAVPLNWFVPTATLGVRTMISGALLLSVISSLLALCLVAAVRWVVQGWATSNVA
jgi:hypothetical protein